MLTPLPQPLGLLLHLAVFAAIVALAAIGGAVVQRAWRGRVLGWAPTCARCGFDLRASARDLPARCPECGRPLAGAVVPGPRRTARPLLAAGTSLIMLAAAVAIAQSLGGPSRLNAWILSHRSIPSLERALRDDDQRAWRLVSDRLRLSRARPAELEWLLDFVTARARANGSWGRWDEYILGVLASTDPRPRNFVMRVLETTLGMPGSLRISTSSEEVVSGGMLGIIVSPSQLLQTIQAPVELRIEGASGSDGAPMPVHRRAGSLDAAIGRPGYAQAVVVTAPEQPGDHTITVRTILRVLDEESPAAADRRSTRMEDPDDAGGAIVAGTDSTAHGRTERAIEGTVRIRVVPKSP